MTENNQDILDEILITPSQEKRNGQFVSVSEAGAASCGGGPGDCGGGACESGKCGGGV